MKNFTETFPKLDGSNDDATLTFTSMFGGWEWDQRGKRVKLMNWRDMDGFVMWDLTVDGKPLAAKVGTVPMSGCHEAVTDDGDTNALAWNNRHQVYELGAPVAAARLLYKLEGVL